MLVNRDKDSRPVKQQRNVAWLNSACKTTRHSSSLYLPPPVACLCGCVPLFVVSICLSSCLSLSNTGSGAHSHKNMRRRKKKKHGTAVAHNRVNLQQEERIINNIWSPASVTFRPSVKHTHTRARGSGATLSGCVAFLRHRQLNTDSQAYWPFLLRRQQPYTKAHKGGVLALNTHQPAVCTPQSLWY